MTQTVQESTAESNFDRTLKAILSAERASWATEAQLLAHGVSTVRLPRSTVVGISGGEPLSSLGFTGAQGPGSTLTGASMVAHAPSVRELLVSRRLPVQAGQLCLARQTQRATKFAQSVGYPVLVRPANGNKTNLVRTVVHSAEEMPAALAKVRKFSRGRTVDRETEVQSAWVQKVPSGTLLRLLVVGSGVVAAVIGSVETDAETTFLATEEIHPEIRSLAVEALAAFPGLDHGEVQIAVDDWAAGTGNQTAVIMTVLASPNLDMYARNGDAGRAVVAEMVRFYLGAAKMAYAEPVRQRRTRTTFTGVVETQRFRRRLKARVSKMVGADVAASDYAVREVGDGVVELTAKGDVEITAMLSTLGVRGLVRGLRASTARTDLLDD
ncbi:hypothetical protein [Citricoccus sp. NR2]|uniref:hypothetical protein n=1 Tax=Citricoccus sp. NR2 TaxID=3004095 RepID=UPI0022DE502F|nr:hypothetical protein [Citricoccus sp. NR2]WBL19783.1 hypothetical protein O1A05_03565 [Citricoccus sp. NR2]